ncbi:Trehalose-phosphatase, partial [Globisporangium splendens]
MADTQAAASSTTSAPAAMPMRPSRIATDDDALASTASSATTTTTTATTTTTVTSPRNEFFVSQRAADYELSKIDTLSLEEQEVLANIQELQLQLMQLRAEEDEDSEDETTPSNAVPGASSSQLIVVSNSLPVLLERVPQTGRWKATKTTGGLDKLMCLTGVRSDLNFLWVGWVGQHIPKHEHESVRRLLLQHNCLPVFLSSEVANRHNGFSSEVLWSLFHYVSEPIALTSQPGVAANKRFNKQDWRAYESANESFADAIAEIYNEGDSVWIHDYHLMLLPSLLRQRLPLCHIGWFLHTPFPSSDVYTRLPVRSQLLTGVLQADLVGFQTFDYERHFLSTCQRLLGVDCSHKGIRSPSGARDHFTSIGVFPIGISVEPFARAASSVQTLNRVNDLHRKFGTKRIILGIDRLDNIKGIPHKLMAMEALLSRFPEWQDNVVLIQIGISSRSGVVDTASSTTSSKDNNGTADNKSAASTAGASNGKAATPASSSESNGSKEGYDSTHQLEMSTQSYRNLLSHVNQLVGRINGTYGTLDYAPIHFIHQRETPHEELCALYDLADVCLVTSTRDGMNLVSHEFIVCQQHFMRRKDERKKAAWTASRAGTNSTSELENPAAFSKDPASFSSPQLSPTKILTEWEGEEGGPGVLVLSEFAGCSQSLSGALVINPWNTEDLASSMHQALSMCRAEREIRQQKLYRYVSANTATAWSMQFLGELGDAVQKNRQSSKQLPKLNSTDIVQAYKESKNRVIILDYDRTLTPQHSLLPLAAVGPNFKSLLDALSADESNTVFILSARERKFLETWLNGVRVGVAAEDGYFYRMNLGNEREQWKTMSKFHYDSATARAAVSSGNTVDTSYLSQNDGLSRRSLSIGSVPSYSSFEQYQSSQASGGAGGAGSTGPLSSTDSFVEEDTSWKDLVLPVMVKFTDRTPGSYIEDKESSLTWYYDDADPHFGGWQAKDLQIILERQLIGTALEVYQGHKWVCVEHEGCTKTKVLEGILKHLSLPQQIAKKNNQEVDFVLCVCDDVTDDQMFQTLNTLVTESNERHETRKKEAEEKTVKRERRNSITSQKSARAQRVGLATASPMTRTKSATGQQIQRKSSVSAAQGKSNPASDALKRREPATARTVADFNNQSLQKLQSGLPQGSEDDDVDVEADIDEDNKVAFSRLHKVPVRMAEDVSIFTVVVGPDVQHSGGRHSWSFAVDSLTDVRKVLKEFVDASRKNSALTGLVGPATSASEVNQLTSTNSLTDAESSALLASLAASGAIKIDAP